MSEQPQVAEAAPPEEAQEGHPGERMLTWMLVLTSSIISYCVFLFRYMAPEVLRGQKPSQASDIFSLAMLLNETLMGQPPYAHLDNDPAVGLAVIQGERPAALNPSSPGALLLLQLIQSMWADDPRARPEATEVFAKAGASVWSICIIQPTYSQLALFVAHRRGCR